VALFACACKTGPTPEEQRAIEGDVRALQDAMGADATPNSLAEVDRAVAEDKPVLAATLLANGAIPAARQQVSAIEAITVQSDRGAKLRTEALRVYRRREAALEVYRRALERGVVEDESLVHALHAQRTAEEALVALDRKLEKIRPLRRRR